MPFKVVSGAGVGAAAVIAGLSLAGPQALGVANADTAAADSTSVSAGPADPSAVSGQTSSRARPAASRAGRGVKPSESVVSRVEALPSADVTSARVDRGLTVLRDQAVTPARHRPAASSNRVQSATSRLSVFGAAVAEPSDGGQAEADVLLDAPEATAVPLTVVGAADGAAEPGRAMRGAATRVRPDTRFAAKPSLGVPVAVLLDQQVVRAQASVRQYLDVADQWLAGLPANPVTDFLSGALLLVRRNLFPEVAITSGGERGFVGWDIVRPSKVEESSFFSNGDEPFVAVLRIVSTTGVAGSTKWQFVTDAPSESGSVKPGQELVINDATGDAWFNGDLSVTPLDDAQFYEPGNILKADLMATVAFVFEGDLGNPADDVKILKEFAEPILKKVADIVESTKIPLSTATIADPSATAEALKKLLAAAEQLSVPNITSGNIVDLVKRWGGPLSDANDLVGIGATAFIPTTNALLDTLKDFGIKPSDLGLHNAGEGDGLQEWTNAKNFKESLAGGSLGFISGDIWYGFLSNRWVYDWMPISSFFPWQGEVSYWLKLSAAVR